MKKINKKATLGVGLAMFALADPTQVFNFNNSTLDSTVIKVETQTSYVTNKAASSVTKTIKTWSEDEIGYDASGVLVNGLAKDASGVYYLNNGIKVTGLVQADSGYYYFEEETGKAVTGLVEVDDKTYYFGTDGKRVAGEAVKYTEEDGSTSYYYFDKETAEMVTSKIIEIKTSEDGKNDGKSGLKAGKYCFGSDGKLVVEGLAFGITDEEGKEINTYYVDKRTKQITKKSLISSEGSIYYFGDDGKMATGVTPVKLDSEQKIGTTTYKASTDYTFYFNASGEMEKGLINVSVFEDYDHAGIYYFGANGAAVEGLQIIGSNRYYFRTDSDADDENRLYRYTAVVGTFTDKNKKISKNEADYYFDENGEMVTGFQTVDGKTYYYSEATIDFGQKVKGKTVKINGIEYTFDADGKMATGFKDEDGNKYYYNNGQKVTGWIFDKEKTYYADKDGKIVTGFYKVDGTTYYFAVGTNETDSKSYTKGQMLKGIQKIDTNGKNSKKSYFLGENTGRLVTGWVTADMKDSKGNRKVFYMNEEGVIQTSWQMISGSTYYLGTDGAMATGLQTIKNETYYFGNDGAMRVGFQNVNGSTYYFDEKYSATDGNRGRMLTGIQEINGERYYLDSENGKLATGWLTLGKDSVDDVGKTFYMNSRGVIQTGFQTINIFC